jgi:hypothetical protein
MVCQAGKDHLCAPPRDRHRVLTGDVDDDKPLRNTSQDRRFDNVKALDDRRGAGDVVTVRAGHGVVPHTIGFWLVTAAFVSLQAFGTIPTPLWPLYAVRNALSTCGIVRSYLSAGVPDHNDASHKSGSQMR